MSLIFRILTIFSLLLNPLLFSALLSAQTMEDLRQMRPNQCLIIESEVNLHGESVFLVDGSTLRFKGGKIVNGTLHGNATRIEGKTKSIFSSVTISGDWIVPVISTEMFDDLTSDNSLKNVFALANKKVTNTILVCPGEYWVSISSADRTGISIPGKTSVILDGTIRMKPNGLVSYQVVGIYEDNIVLSGRGIIIGDKYSHEGTSGEWGMGLMITRANNVLIKDISISDCWGDCIYIGGRSTNIHIKNCKLDNGRRQGISITSAKSVIIDKCVITNVSGTNPQYAIDIEPNQNDTVDNVILKRIKSDNCYGGFKIAGREKGAFVGNVIFKSCSISNTKSEYPFEFIRAKIVSVRNCSLHIKPGDHVLYEEIDNLFEERTRINKGDSKTNSEDSRIIRSCDKVAIRTRRRSSIN